MEAEHLLSCSQNLSLDSILSQFDPILTPIGSFSSIYFDVILTYMCISHVVLELFRQNLCMHFSFIPHVLHLQPISLYMM